ncbi:MAG: cardiolipin synthase [Oscillospiraceae bacterium]|nr:cardiolipin synthase [Oscillospiraceae bacterium]MBQ7130197.1 cardiolipin synthase [Oscillospiraceae bacterium]
MSSNKKLHFGNAVPRMVLVGLSILFQVGWLLLSVLVLNESLPWIEGLTRLLSLTVILQLNSEHTNAAYKMPWIMLILAFPVMGLSLYVMIGMFRDMGGTGKRLRAIRRVTRSFLKPQDSCLKDLKQVDDSAVGVSEYLQNHNQCPVYENTAVRYFGEPADALDAMKEDLRNARDFIFMEYFIVSSDSAFQEISDILVEKARQGVDVRFMYDDVGSVGYVNMFFAKRLADAGIHCMIFNPALPFLNLFMNHRDHRKITVIDGKVGYTGGYNLSDEYFGRKITYGRWKDSGIRMEGDAVRTLTAQFLETWNACTRKAEDVTPFLTVSHKAEGADCFVQPYEDNPLGGERTAESVYMNLIYTARKTLWVMTPYLIITDEMTNALGMAAKRGVDVRIITPGVPDKKTIYAVTRSYYAGLASQGVRIFEFTPGFCHAKQMLCDGRICSIGTSNLDYRSLYLHFENNVLLYGGEAVKDIARDFEELFPQCREVTEKYRTGRSRALQLGQYILRLFAPLL